MHSKVRLKLIHSPTLQPEDWLRFVWIEPFPGQWARLKLTERDAQALEVLIVSAPRIGKALAGTDGLRKARFSVSDSNTGKSGAYRVFYVFLPEYGTVLLWAIIAKNQEGNLSKADRNAIAKEIRRLKHLLEQGIIR